MSAWKIWLDSMPRAISRFLGRWEPGVAALRMRMSSVCGSIKVCAPQFPPRSACLSRLAPQTKAPNQRGMVDSSLPAEPMVR